MLRPAAFLLALAGSPALACGDSYTVVSGDTMNKIAAFCGVTTESLKAANPTVDPYRMAVGAVLRIDGSAVLPGLPGNRPPDPDGDGPFLSWLELAPGEPDPTLPGGGAVASLGTGLGTGIGTGPDTVADTGTIGLGDLAAAGIGGSTISTTSLGTGLDGAPAEPVVVGSLPAPAEARPGLGDGPLPAEAIADDLAASAAVPLNPYDPALAAQAQAFPVTTDLGTPPAAPRVVSAPQRARPTVTRQARPQRGQPVIRLTRSQAQAAIRAIRAGQRSGTIGGLNLADPAARRALRRALGL